MFNGHNSTIKSSQVNTIPIAKSKTRSKQNKDMHKFSSVYSERGVPLPVILDILCIGIAKAFSVHTQEPLICEESGPRIRSDLPSGTNAAFGFELFSSVGQGLMKTF